MSTALDPTQLLLIRELASGERVSGAQLAAVAGISREAISKRIQRLADFGLTVDSQAGLGYQLSPALDLLDPRWLQRQLTPRCAVTVLPTVDSTNAWLSEQAQVPHLCLAEHQSAGRGRRGRRWHSPFGCNLYLSLRWDCPQWPERLAALSLVVGVALATHLRDQGIAIDLKWPNDLYLGGRKLGGLLIEQSGEAGGPCRLVIGLGINLAMGTEVTLDQAWTSLAQHGHHPARNTLALGVARALITELEALSDSRISARLEQFADFDIFDGQPVQILQGPAPLSGIARGIDQWGRLQVDNDQGRHHISAGDVSLRAAD